MPTKQKTGRKVTSRSAPQSAPGGGKSNEELVRKSNLWRDNYNPMRGLTIARLLSIFESAERGAYAELQLLIRKAEKRFPILKGFIERLLSSIEELNWDVKVMKNLPEGATAEMAEKQRKFLRGRYDLLKNLNDVFGQLALAEIRGYAILQKHYYTDGVNDGAVEELYWIEPWCWARDGYYGDFYYNENSRIGVGLGSCQSILGEENRIGSDNLPREDFVIREVDSPLYEIALTALANWLMARKDYAAFIEIFGIPNAIVIMPPNIAIGKEEDFRAAAEKVADGVSGALPAGSEVEFPTANTRGESPFEKFDGAQERDVVVAGTGGQLTMISMPTGIGKGASEEHDAAWQKIAATKARRINESLQRDFDATELAREFPGEPVCVYFELAIEDEEDVSSLADTVVKFEEVGLQTDEKEIGERVGMKLTRVAISKPPPGDPNAPKPGDLPEENLRLKNRSEFPSAVAQDLQPFLKAISERIDAVFSITDPELRLQKFREAWAELEPLRKDIAADPKSAHILEELNAAALAKGLKGDKP